MALIWGVAAKTHLKKLQVLQNRALNVFKKPYRTSTVELFRNVAKAILPIVGLHKFENLKMTYEMLKMGESPKKRRRE